MNKRGLSLMEVIVSALILAITVGGVLYVFSTEKGVVARTGRQVQAMDFARQTLEELKNAVSADTWPFSGTTGTPNSTRDDLGGLKADVTFTDTLDAGAFRDKFFGGRKYTVTNIDADTGVDAEGDGFPANDVDYKMVEVVVEWEEPAIEE